MSPRCPLLARLLTIALGALALLGVARAESTAQEVLEKYAAARGGAERWSAAKSIELRGVYAAFSDQEPFTLVRSPGRLYRLDFTILGAPAVRAHDATGPWWLHPLLQPEPGRLEEGPYKSQLERESHFAPLLVDLEASGAVVELVGPGDIDGTAVVSLRVSLPSGAVETWHLSAESWLEVAVDSQVHDFTQSGEPMRQRAFFDDFRDVDGLVLPFRVDHEFGHRLESMTVEEARVDGEVDAATFSPPAAESPEE